MKTLSTDFSPESIAELHQKFDNPELDLDTLLELTVKSRRLLLTTDILSQPGVPFTANGLVDQDGVRYPSISIEDFELKERGFNLWVTGEGFELNLTAVLGDAQIILEKYIREHPERMG